MNSFIKYDREFNFDGKSFEIGSLVYDELSDLEKFEYELNVKYISFHNYSEIENSIVNFPLIEKFECSKEELVNHFEEKLNNSISMDREYLINELLFFLIPHNKKKQQLKKLLISLKKCINEKIKKDINYKFIVFKLMSRFIIHSENFEIDEQLFIKKICRVYFKNIDIKNDFSYVSNFAKFFFFKYKKNKSLFYNILLNYFNIFTDKSYKKILKKDYEPTRNYGLILGNIYKKINDYKKSMFFYQIEIDNGLLFCKKSNENIIKKELVISEITKIAINIQYRQKEVKNEAKKIATHLIENDEDFFPKVKDKKLGESILFYFESMEDLINGMTKMEERLDFIVYCIFHNAYNEERYMKDKTKKKNNLFLSFFPSSRIDIKGFSHSVDKETFHFFNSMLGVNNNLFLYLDYKLNWIHDSQDILISNINNMKLINKDFKKQYKFAIDCFVDEKYIEFMYIAPSMIELLLKSFLEKIDGDLLSFRESFSEKTLKQIIETLIKDENSYLDNYVLKYISFVLAESQGLNLRNNIVHGSFQDNRFNKNNAMYIYIILIYLVRYFNNDE